MIDSKDGEWTIPLTGFTVSYSNINQSNVSEFKLHKKTGRSLIDTGTSYIMIPEPDFSNFREHLEQTKNCNY